MQRITEASGASKDLTRYAIPIEIVLELRHQTKKLQNSEFAAEFLNAVSENEDPKTYLTALRQEAEARGGIKEVVEKSKRFLESFYRTLSARGNPTIKTL